MAHFKAECFTVKVNMWLDWYCSLACKDVKWVKYHLLKWLLGNTDKCFKNSLFLLCGCVSKAFEGAGLNLACRTASELHDFLVITFLIWFVHFPRSHVLKCHLVVCTSIANGPSSFEELNLRHRCKNVCILYSQCCWNKPSANYMISWITGTLSEPVCLLGKVHVAGLWQFPQKMPIGMRILFCL